LIGDSSALHLFHKPFKYIFIEPKGLLNLDSLLNDRPPVESLLWKSHILSSYVLRSLFVDFLSEKDSNDVGQTITVNYDEQIELG